MILLGQLVILDDLLISIFLTITYSTLGTAYFYLRNTSHHLFQTVNPKLHHGNTN